jgi:uncharacterized membrane protein
MRLIRNVFRSVVLLALTGVLVYSTYTMNGNPEIPLATKQGTNLAADLILFFLGLLLVASWAKKKRRPSERLSEALSLTGTNTGAASAASRGKTGRRD